MRVLVAPDKFAGTMTAGEAAAAIRSGWLAAAPADQLELLPLSDGGPGFLDVLVASLGGSLEDVPVTGPLGSSVQAQLLIRDTDGTGRTGYVESAQACGLHLVPPGERRPEASTSFGLGELLAAARSRDCGRVVVGVGGTAGTDGGAGMRAALGARPARVLQQGGGALAGIRSVDLAPAKEALEGMTVVAATDVGGPLMGSDGAALGYAAQKGADRATRDLLETAMREWATATDGGMAVKSGAGAGGGIGFGLLLLGAARVPGASVVIDATRLAARATEVDLVLTGEGAFDWQSLRGKLVAAVARAAQEAARPVVVLAGRVEVGRRELANAGIDSAYAVDDLPAEQGGDRPPDRLAALASRVARTWSPPTR